MLFQGSNGMADRCVHLKNGAGSSARFFALNWAGSKAIYLTHLTTIMNRSFSLTCPVRRRSSENGLRPLMSCWVNEGISPCPVEIDDRGADILSGPVSRGQQRKRRFALPSFKFATANIYFGVPLVLGCGGSAGVPLSSKKKRVRRPFCHALCGNRTSSSPKGVNPIRLGKVKSAPRGSTLSSLPYPHMAKSRRLSPLLKKATGRRPFYVLLGHRQNYS
jgi:hypothetical protein